jgi:hypothetical protein
MGVESLKQPGHRVSFPRPSSPLVFFCLLILLARIGNRLAFARGSHPPLAFDMLFSPGLFWLAGWWLKDDLRKRKSSWVYCLGIFMSVVWPVFLTY